MSSRSASAAPPPNTSSATPAIVDLAKVQQKGQSGPQGSKPYRHAGGQAKLDQEKAEGKSHAPSKGIQTQPAGPRTAAPQAPIAGVGFDGISDAESFCNCLPPDGAIGVGPSNVVAAVNTAVKIWDTSGVTLVASTSLGSLFSANTACLPTITDPAAQYDAGGGGHFMLEALTFDSRNNSTVCIAISKTADPTGTYFVYGFKVTNTGFLHDLLDFPQVAIGSDAIYLAGNQFKDGSAFSGVRVYAYDKAQMYAGTTATSVFHDVSNDAAGLTADSLYPAKGVTVPNTAYFLGADNNCGTRGGCNNISLWKWSSPFGANTFSLQGGTSFVQPYVQPPSATEPGGTTDTGDARNLGAAYSLGSVYGAHAIGCNPGGGTVPCVQWYQLTNVDATPTLTQQGIVSGSGQSRYYPNLSVDKAGNMLMGYAYASSSEYPGVRYTGRLASDPPNTLQTEAVMKAGEGYIDGSRYGDYAGEQVAPDGCTVWHLEEYAKTGASWGTWIGSMKVAGCGVAPAAPTSLTAVAASSTQVNLSWSASVGATSYKVQRYGSATWSVVATPSGTAYSDTGLSPNTTYSYRILASNVTGDSPPSTVASATTSLWVASYSVAGTPTTWAPYETKTYSVTVTNTGTQTWPASGPNPVYLGAHFANTGGGYGNNTWSTDQRFSLAADLVPGGTATLSLSITAPSTTGNLVLEYQMVKTWQFWFGQFSDVNVSVSGSPPWASSYDVATTPTSWAPSEIKTYSVTVTNTGTQTWPWSGPNPVYLGVHFANLGGGYGSNTWSTDQRFSLAADLVPGGTATVSLSIAAPSTTGNLVLEYQMVKTSQFWFGQFSDVSVSVSGSPPWVATYSVTGTPASWAAGETKTYSVSVTNSGTQTWPAGGPYPAYLGVHFADIGGGYSNNTWSTDQRFSLAADLAPGGTATVSLSITAPSTTGNLVLEYQMVKTRQFWFSQFSDVNVRVT